MCLTVGRQSRDHRPLSRDPSVSFYKKFPNCLKRPKTLFDSQPTVAWPPTTVAWPFSDFFQKISNCLKRPKTLFDSRPTVAWPQPLSRDRSATFFKIFPNRLKRPETLFDSRPTVAWPPTTVAWPFSDFFQKFSNCLKRPKNVVWQSADGRVTSDHCRVTVQRLFSKFSQIAWNVQKTLFDSRPTVAWPPTTVAWPFSDFFQKNSNCLKRPKNVVWQSADGRVTSDHCRVTVQRLFSKFSKSLETSKNVVWQSADGRVTSDHCRVTVQRLFSKNFLIAWNVQKRYLTVARRSRDHRLLSPDRSATFFKIFPNCFKRPRTLFDSRSTFAWPPFTVAWLRLLSSVFVSYGFCIR